jgi:PAS domain S-box-containing protein
MGVEVEFLSVERLYLRTITPNSSRNLERAGNQKNQSQPISLGCMSQSEEATSKPSNYIWLYRLLGVMAAINIPWFRAVLPAEAYDPMWMRWTLSGILIGLIAYSRFRPLTLSTVTLLTHGMAALIPIWMIYLAWENHFMPEYLTSYCILFLSCSLIFRSQSRLFTFLGVQVVSVLLASLTVSDPMFSPLLISSMVVTGVLIVGAATFFNIRFNAHLAASEVLQRTILQSAFEHSFDGMLVTSQAGHVLYYNQRLLDMWGMVDADMDPKVLRAGVERVRAQIINPQVFEESFQRSQANPHIELRDELITKDGRHIQRNSKPIFENEKHLGRIWFFTDVTATRKQEAEYKQNRKKLHRQNQALVKLAGNPAIQTGDLEGVFAVAAQVISQVLEVDRTGIWLLDSAGERLHRSVMMDAEGQGSHESFVIKASTSPLYFHSIETERVIAIENTSLDPRTAPFVGLTGNERIHASLDAPIRHAGRVVGIVCAETRHDTRVWTDDEQNFIVSVGDLLTVAMQTEARVKAEKAQTKSLAVIRALLQQGGIGVLITDLDRNVLEFNKKYLEFWNLDAEFLLSSSADTVMAYCRSQTNNPEELQAIVGEIQANPLNEQCDLIYFKNGRVLERQTTPVRTDDGVFARAWIYRDITARIQAEEQLLTSERRSQAFVNAIPDLILRLDAQHMVIDHKLPPQHDFGDWAKGIRGAQLWDLFPPAMTELADQALETALETGRASDFQLEMDLGKGARDYEARIVAAGHQEFLLLLRDITERKRTEKELLQRNFELDSFVYRASHDLKAPLNSLMGLIEITRTETKEDTTIRYLQMMDRSVVKLDTFIRNLADFSRIARSEQHLEDVDLRALIDEILESLRYMDHADRVESRVLVPPGTILRADPLYLGVVITNLISNAIKYQNLRQPTPWIAIELESTDHEVVIKVEDNGVGIPLEHHSRIFNLFFRASTQSFGSGIGLYITRNTALKMGGTLDFSSMPGAGTTFSLRLPRQSTT